MNDDSDLRQVRVCTYLLDEFVGSIFLQFSVKEAAVADYDLTHSVLLEKEWIRFLVLFGVLVSQILEQDCLLPGCSWVQMLQGLIVCATEFFERAPFMGSEFTNEYLAWVALTSQIDLLSVDLVWYVDQEHVEEVIRNVVWLEDDLDFVRLVCCDRALLWNKHEWDLLTVIFNTADLAFKIKVDWEGGHVLNLERLLCRLTNEHVAKRYDSIFRCDFDLRANTGTLQKHRDHSMIREHDHALLLYLLE